MCTHNIPALTLIFQQSLDTGAIPDDWRLANIVPVFKKGNRATPSNYRPVSLTSIPCKLLEHILVSHIMDHLDLHNTLIDEQHGFRHGRSCESQLIITTHDLAQSLDNHTQVDMAILDFSKAFDRVPHKRLATKLEYYGVRHNIKQWLINLLHHRTQRVVVDGVSSQGSEVLSGVPQGTVIGPLLFLLFINDITDDIEHSQLRLFADDCLIYRKIHSEDDKHALQQDLDKLMSWSQTWQMSFNVAKCYTMNLSLARKHKMHNTYSMGGNQLSVATTNPYLGVEISQDLKWSHHISKITGKANRVLGLLRRNLRHTPREVKETAYKSLVRPILEYASPVWDPWQQKDKDKVEAVQRQAARFVMGKPHNPHKPDSVSAMLQDLEWDTLEKRRQRSSVIMLYRVVNLLVAVPLPYHPTPVRPSIITRTAMPHCFTLYQPRINAFKYSFFVRSVILWNHLPTETAEAPSLIIFKGLLDQHSF
jgi:hypothetical protein